MERFKVNEYIVREKGKDYSVLVFPFIKYMWAFDDYPAEDCYMVDGTAEAFSLLKYALAILIEASDKIIYFPCKNHELSTIYSENYNLVLCTPKAQLRRSSWIAIRKKPNASTKKGSYCLQYNRKKLDDYCRKYLFEKGYNQYHIKTEIWKKIQKEYLEELVGENLFFVLGKLECYVSHYDIAENLDKLESCSEIVTWSALGLILTPTAILRLQNLDQERQANKHLNMN